MNPPATGSVEICVVHRFVGILNTCAFPQEEIQMQKVGGEKILYLRGELILKTRSMDIRECQINHGSIVHSAYKERFKLRHS